MMAGAGIAREGSPEEVRLLAGDGWELSVLRLPAIGARRGSALVLPAMMVDRRSMERPEGAGFVTTLRAGGFEVWLADWRGHGASGPTVDEGGSWTYDDLVRYDVPAFLEAVRERRPDDFLWTVGHSLGGHVSLAAAGSGLGAGDGHVLLSSNIWRRDLEPSPLIRAEKAAAIAGFLAVTRLAGRFPSRRLGIGPADEARPYIEDTCRFWRDDLWGSRDGVDYAAGMARVTGPILGLVGAGDRLMARPAGAINWARLATSADLEARRVGRGDLGLAFDPDHMGLVTDERCRPVWRYVAGWMAARSVS